MPKPRFVPPGPPAPALTGREIAISFPFSDVGVRLRQRFAPEGQFDGNRKLWVVLPEEAQALAAGALQALRRCLDTYASLPVAHTGKQRAMRRDAEDLRKFPGALQRDRRVWTPETRQEWRDLLVDVREHDAIADPARRLW